MGYRLKLKGGSKTITFDIHELPEQIPLGGEQLLAVHKFPGGYKSIQALGAFDEAVEWSGEFLYEEAMDRAAELDSMRRAGKQLTLSWGPISLPVVIASFTYQPQNKYSVPYTIKLEVCQEPPIGTTLSLDALAVAANAVAQTNPPEKQTVTYVVQHRDSLSKISNRFGVTWQAIYEANADKIKNPSMIYAGMELVIPVENTDNTSWLVIPSAQ